MFDIIIKQKPIIVNCYTNNYSVYEHSKIQKATNFVPQWFKKLNNDKRNMTGCPGFIELYKKSFIYPMWEDLRFFSYESQDQNQEPELFEESASGQSLLSSHNAHEHNYSFRPGFKHVKFTSPWYIKTKSDLDWIVVAPFWNNEQKNADVFIPPAIDNYKHQHSTTWQMFIKTDGTPVTFKAGEPLMQMIPKTDKSIILNTYYDPPMVKKLDESTNPIHFFKSYYKKIKMKKK